MYALIFADNKYQTNRMGILRAPGAHRIATHLRRQHISTEVVDFYLNWSIDELKRLIDCQLTKPTLFIGFSCSLMFDGIENFSVIRDYIRSKNLNIPIIVGGNKTLQKGFDGADYYLEGTGEASITALVEHLQSRTKEIKYHYLDGNKVLDGVKDYPVHSIQGLDIEYLASDFIGKNEILSLETARGCIFKCAFCDFPNIGKSKVDYLRNKNEIKDELIRNYRDHGTTKYFIVEDTINDTDQKCEMLAELTSELPFKLSFMGYMRADLLISKPKNLDLLMRSGFRAMHFGIETFNEPAGKIIGKGMPVKKLQQGLVDIKNRYPTLNTQGTFIVGLPYDTKEGILESLDWLISTRALDFWSFNPLMIPKRDPTVHSSYFTDNYRLYGYSVMSNDEVKSRLNELDNTINGMSWWKNIIYWRSKNFDFMSATQFVTIINKLSYRYRKIDGWGGFAISAFDSLDNIFQMSYNGDNKIDDVKLLAQTHDYINDYKQKKLDFFQNQLTK